ncbi:hypothetical protein [Actinoallomurus acaciae]|uniref:Tyr recombinase domain-containing protein n=1 Tax=Actinoallomurus acaciae TaxID=502577 RepID=A0ABV5YBD9_9ACTN
MDVHRRVAMQILRHSQISVTMNVYSEVSSEATRRRSSASGSVWTRSCTNKIKKAGSMIGTGL